MSLTDEQHEELMRGKSTLAYGRAIESATAAPLLERIQELEESERSSERARVKLCSIHQYQKEALIARIAELEKQLDAGARKLAELFDYPWEHMPEQGRQTMRNNVIAVLQAIDAAIKENRK